MRDPVTSSVACCAALVMQSLFVFKTCFSVSASSDPIQVGATGTWLRCRHELRVHLSGSQRAAVQFIRDGVARDDASKGCDHTTTLRADHDHYDFFPPAISRNRMTVFLYSFVGSDEVYHGSNAVSCECVCYASCYLAFRFSWRELSGQVANCFCRIACERAKSLNL